MFASSLQLHKLAFGNFLNTLYTSLLLITFLLLVLRFFKAKKAQEQWAERWQEFSEICTTQFDRVVKFDDKSLIIQELSSLWLGDLAARIKSAMPLPEPEVQVDSLLSTAMQEHPLLSWEVESHSDRWQQLSGVSILLGLLGTFFGLTAALTQLPLQGGLKELTGGLQEVLPLMGVAFWTSVCGLIASLMIRLTNSFIQSFRKIRLETLQQYKQQLSRRLLLELYPRLKIEELRTSQESSLDEDKLQEIIENALKKSLVSLQDSLKTLLEPLSKLSLSSELEPLRLELGHSSKELHAWNENLSASQKTLQAFITTNTEALEPIAQTERLLSERISSLTRQHQALGETLLQLDQYQNNLPNKMRDLIKNSLRPAHHLLQRAGLHLGQLLEQNIEKQTKERAEWRQEFSHFNKNLDGIVRLHHNTETMNQELARIADHLLELSSRMSFYPNTRNDEQSNREVLEEEIESLLDGIDENINSISNKKP